MKKIVLQFSSLLTSLQGIMKIMGGICLACMAILTSLDVIADIWFKAPIFGSEELVAFLAVLALAFALPAAHEEKSHIGVELFTRMLSSKVQNNIRLVTDMISFALFLLVAWRMLLYAGTKQASGEVSMNLALPGYYVIYILSVSFFVFALMIFKDILTLTLYKDK